MAAIAGAARGPPPGAITSPVSLKDIDLGILLPDRAWPRGRVMHAASRSGSIQTHLSDSSRQGLGIHRVDSAASMPERCERRHRSWSPDAPLRWGWKPFSRRTYRKARDAMRNAHAQALAVLNDDEPKYTEARWMLDSDESCHRKWYASLFCCCLGSTSQIEHDGDNSKYEPPIETPLASTSSIDSMGAGD